MIVVTVFLSILNQMEIHLLQNRKENCHHDHIQFNVKGNGNTVFSVYDVWQRTSLIRVFIFLAGELPLRIHMQAPSPPPPLPMLPTPSLYLKVVKKIKIDTKNGKMFGI